MKKIITILFLTTLTLNAFAYKKIKIKAVVLRVFDGDTIKARLKSGRIFKVRFWGIDAPESNTRRYGHTEKYGEKATQFVKDMIEGKIITLVTYHRNGVPLFDRYKRLLAYVYYDENKCLFRDLLLSGLAKVYRRELCTRYDEFVKYEKIAKINKTGIWEQ